MIRFWHAAGPDRPVSVSASGFVGGLASSGVADQRGPYEDWLICMISSRVHQRIDGFDERIEEDDEDFVRSGLKVRSVIRICRLAVVGGEMLEGSMGTIDPERMTRIRRKLADWIGNSGES